ncbi:MAG: hypothetical protein HY394_04195 [Candidatus Diapherotrites archaeon]|nr:hypothetical protein [Candidatus Diapherotrites archaeon]
MRPTSRNGFLSWKSLLLAVLLLAFVVRIAPLAVDSFVDPDGYFHLRHSQSIVDSGNVPSFDPLSMQGRYYSYAPLQHVIFAVFSVLSGIPLYYLIRLLPSLYGVFGILLVFVFARRLFGSGRTAFFAALSLSILSIHVLRTGSNARPDGLSLLVVPAIIFLLFIRRPWPAMLLAVAQALLHPLSAFIGFFALACFCIVSRFRQTGFSFRQTAFAVLPAALVFLAWLFSQHYLLTMYVSRVSLDSAEAAHLSFVNFIIFFSTTAFFVLPGLLFFKARNSVFLRAWFLSMFAVAIFSNRLSIFAAVPAAMLAGYGIDFVFRKTLPYRKIFAMLFLVLALAFSVSLLWQTSRFADFSERSAMQWIGGNTVQDANIFGSWDRGHPLAYFASRAVVIDGYFEFAPRLKERNDSMNAIIGTSDCGKIRAEYSKWNANYFFVHKSALNSNAFKNGILEAEDCANVSRVFSSDGAAILAFAK